MKRYEAFVTTCIQCPACKIEQRGEHTTGEPFNLQPICHRENRWITRMEFAAGVPEWCRLEDVEEKQGG